MLNSDALAQLRQLKQDIHDSKDRGEGLVKGSQGRFGFVALDDGREIYLPPEQMQRVFPDDRIAIEVIPGSDGKSAAQLERLLASPLRAFTGRYVIRDNAHFVEPDLPRLSRWIFVPPKLRGKAGNTPKHGDWVRASITQHPFNDGKPQARIDAVIGNDNQKGIEARYALARFNLPDKAPQLIEADIAQPDFLSRRDLTALPFVTIDGAETRDMDDALFAERVASDASSHPANTVWKLSVAIADPEAWIKPGSALEQIIATRSNSAYLPGLCVPMLPEQLANDRCSLMPDVERLAIVCELWLDASGQIQQFEFCEARIRSHAKLSYEQVAEFLRATENPSEATQLDCVWSQSVRELHALSLQLQQQRQRENIVLPERAEYRMQLDENGKPASYQRQMKNAAHQIVEECMVATNRCAAEYLRAENAIFVSHAGFRSERHDNIQKLLSAELPEAATHDIANLDNYVDLIHKACAATTAVPLLDILLRSMERAQFSATALPHFGMGVPCYTTITSPIRKFNDFLAQRALKTKLRGEPNTSIAAERIAHIQDCADRTRQAANFAQQWLDCQFVGKQIKDAESAATIWQATIVHVTSSGLLVRLNDNGIQGLVDTRHTGEKYSFDAVYMRLKSATRTFELEQQIAVTFASIDEKKHQIAFKLAAPAADSAIISDTAISDTAASDTAASKTEPT